VIAPLQILLVEDDPATSFVTKRALRACADVAVTVARDGADALEQLSASGLPLDRTIVVTDLDMPRMSGLQLISVMRGEPSLADVPVLVITASSDDGDRRAARSLNVAGYYRKTPGGEHLRALCAWVQRAVSGARYLAP
jgi:CheY-like chemotaxis protein